MINIVIVDDHPIVLKGLIGLLSEEKDMKIVASVESAEQLFVELERAEVSIDVVILDYLLPNMNGYDALLELKNRFPLVKVLMLSVMKEFSFAEKMISVGAKGFLRKESTPEDLLEAIRVVASGRVYRMDSSIQTFNEHRNDKIRLLSDRELQVLILLGEGKTVGEIANLVILSVKTISTYRARLLAKLDFKNNNEIIKFCVENKMV